MLLCILCIFSVFSWIQKIKLYFQLNVNSMRPGICLFVVFLVFVFWLLHVACRILVPQSGINPVFPAVEEQQGSVFLVYWSIAKTSNNVGEGDGTPLQYLAWKIPWTEEPGRLQSMGSLRVGHDWATSLSLLTFMHWRRKWQPTPVFLPGESQGRGSLVGCHLWGRTESDTTEAT